MKKKLCVLVCAILFNLIASGQQTSTKKADKLFNNWDFYDASVLYQRAIAKHATQYDYFKLGECYRRIARYAEALEAFDKVDSMGPYYQDSLFYLYYGWMLNSNDRCEEARKSFMKFDSLIPSDPRGKLFMNSCEIELEDHQSDLPIDVSEVSRINTNGSDFCPVLYKDGIVFTSDRNEFGPKDNWTGRGLLKLYYSPKSAGGPKDFRKVVPMDELINSEISGPCCFSKNYDTIYFSRVEIDKQAKKSRTFKEEKIVRNKLYSAVMRNGAWTDLTPFYLNSDSFSVTHPCLSRDGSRIYFSSDMPGGYGGSDIYYCQKEATGWGKPINLGPNINTSCREGFPTFDSIGDLYFSSDGFSGSGGLNICVSRLVNGEYQKARVLKFPFNSSGDDFCLTFLKDQKTGYFSSNRNGGNGDDDIYYFDMGSDKDAVTSLYTIGYKKKKPGTTPVAGSTVKPGAIRPTPPIPLAFHINFDFDKYEIRPVDIKILNSCADYMLKDSNRILQINGHTDPKGTLGYNQVLSERRANRAVQYLIAKGVNEDHIRIAAYGKRKLLLKEDIYHKPIEIINRRDELLVESNNDSVGNNLYVRHFRDTNYPDTWFNRAHLKMILGEYQTAIAEYTRAIDLLPNYADAWFGRAQVYDEIHDSVNALNDYSTAIQIDSGYIDAYYLRGCNRLKLKDAIGAVEDFTYIINTDSTSYYVYYMRGKAFNALEKYDKAIQDLNISIKLKPDNKEAYTARSYAYSKEGNMQKSSEDEKAAHSIGKDGSGN